MSSGCRVGRALVLPPFTASLSHGGLAAGSLLEGEANPSQGLGSHGLSPSPASAWRKGLL